MKMRGLIPCIPLAVLGVLHVCSAYSIVRHQSNQPTRLEELEEAARDRRVIGGEEVEEGEWPWLASLQGKIPDVFLFGLPVGYRRFYCGASLINSRWILTAAHCFLENEFGDEALDPDYWSVRLGDIDLSADVLDKAQGILGDLLEKDDWKEWTVDAEKIVIHPNYNNKESWANDIALMKLKEEIPHTAEILPHIQSVELPPHDVQDWPIPRQDCVMKGWGCTEGGGGVSDHARAVLLPAVDDKTCGDFWRVSTTTRMCAGYNLESKGICPGDSGGPLVCERDGRWVQAGIASFTSASRPGNVPGAFTRVSAYIDWIMDTIMEG